MQPGISRIAAESIDWWPARGSEAARIAGARTEPSKRKVVIPRDHGERLCLDVVEQVGVVAGPVDVVEVVDQFLDGEVGGEPVQVEALGEFVVEGLVVGIVDELEELDERGQVTVVFACFDIEDVFVGVRIVAPVAVVAGRLCFVQDAVVREGVDEPHVVGVLHDQAEHLLAAGDAEGGIGGVLSGEAGGVQQFERHRFVQSRL